MSQVLRKRNDILRMHHDLILETSLTSVEIYSLTFKDIIIDHCLPYFNNSSDLIGQIRCCNAKVKSKFLHHGS